MSLLSVLKCYFRATFASQLAMDVAGQNISNADVEGYSQRSICNRITGLILHTVR